MTWLEFIAAIVPAIAWPLTAMLLAILFRHEIRSKLLQLRSIKVGDLEADMRELERVSEAIESGAVVKSAPPEKDPHYAALRSAVEDQIHLAVATVPGQAISLAWTLVEGELSTVSRQRAALLTTGGESTPTAIIRTLRDELKIDPAFANALEQLWRMKRRAEVVQATGESVRPDDAQSYAKIAMQAADRLHNIDVAA